jgi:hypothetical protein
VVKCHFTAVFRHEVINVIIVAIPTNIKVAKFGTTVVGPFMALNALEPFCMRSGHGVRLCTFNTEAFIIIFLFT